VNTGPMERGAAVDLGPTCVLRHEGMRVIVTSRKEAAVDPAFFALALRGPDRDATARRQGQRTTSAPPSRNGAAPSWSATAPALPRSTSRPFRSAYVPPGVPRH
jgi:hypothetical protein